MRTDKEFIQSINTSLIMGLFSGIALGIMLMVFIGSNC